MENKIKYNLAYINNYKYLDKYIKSSVATRPRSQREHLRVASRIQSDVKSLNDFVCFKVNRLNLAAH